MQTILYVPSWVCLTLVSAGGNKGVMKVLERNRFHLIPAFSVFPCDLHGRWGCCLAGYSRLSNSSTLRTPIPDLSVPNRAFTLISRNSEGCVFSSATITTWSWASFSTEESALMLPGIESRLQNCHRLSGFERTPWIGSRSPYLSSFLFKVSNLKCWKKPAYSTNPYTYHLFLVTLLPLELYLTTIHR